MWKVIPTSYKYLWVYLYTCMEDDRNFITTVSIGGWEVAFSRRKQTYPLYTLLLPKVRGTQLTTYTYLFKIKVKWPWSNSWYMDAHPWKIWYSRSTSIPTLSQAHAETPTDPSWVCPKFLGDPPTLPSHAGNDHWYQDAIPWNAMPPPASQWKVCWLMNCGIYSIWHMEKCP
jgi:hypothetical protein